MENNPENQGGIGKYGDGQNSLRTFLPQIITYKSSIQNILFSKSPCSFFQATFVDATEYQCCEMKQDWKWKATELPYQISSAGKWGWKQHMGKREKK